MEHRSRAAPMTRSERESTMAIYAVVSLVVVDEDEEDRRRGWMPQESGCDR